MLIIYRWKYLVQAPSSPNTDCVFLTSRIFVAAQLQINWNNKYSGIRIKSSLGSVAALDFVVFLFFFLPFLIVSGWLFAATSPDKGITLFWWRYEVSTDLKDSKPLFNISLKEVEFWEMLFCAWFLIFLISSLGLIFLWKKEEVKNRFYIYTTGLLRWTGHLVCTGFQTCSGLQDIISGNTLNYRREYLSMYKCVTLISVWTFHWSRTYDRTVF